MFDKERVLVAGGAGFVGSHLCRALLAEGCEVVCLDSLLTGRPSNIRDLRRRNRFRFVQADITGPLPDDIGKVDAIYNLACAASPVHYQANPVHTMMTSVNGTRNLLDLAERDGARLLLASTSEIYGDPDRHPQSETYHGNVNPTGPRACYDEGKRAAESLCCDYQRMFGVDSRIARIFNTYGPNMRPDDGRIVSNAICQALLGQDITVYGDGRQTRSFCYVDDLVRGLTQLMDFEGEVGGPVNLGNPCEISVSELVRLVVRSTGSASRLVTRPLPVDDPRRRRPDISRARDLLGWQPEVTLEHGLAETVSWFSRTLGTTALKPEARSRTRAVRRGPERPAAAPETA